MTKAILLSDLVDEFVATLRSNAYAANTVRNHSRPARYLLAHVGNIQVRHITPRHIDSYLAKRKTDDDLSAASLNVDLVGLRALFRHAVERRYLAPHQDPTQHRRNFREVPRDRLRLPAAEFPRLLDACEHPRDRIIVALGLYLFLRKSEIKALRVGDVDLARGVVTVRVEKTKQLDHMPISAELDAELRRWLTWYAASIDRPLDQYDHLVPAKTPPLYLPGQRPYENFEEAKMQARLKPEKPCNRPEEAVHRVLTALGYPVRDEDGGSLREGVHTLRRSGARALFDRLVAEGYDYAIRTVQSMLHHKSIVVTEGYLGVRLDEKRRDEIVRGKPLFPVSEENVVRMEKVNGEANAVRAVV